MKCFDERCGYVERDNRADPLCPALAAAAEDHPPDRPPPLLDAAVPLEPIAPADLPHCPACRRGLLRPGVVWFGESLDQTMLQGVENWLMAAPRVDVMLVVGTAAAVYPAARYVAKAKRRGAVVAVVNPDPESADGLESGDFFFQGSAAEILPRLLEGVIGSMGPDGKIVEG